MSVEKIRNQELYVKVRDLVMKVFLLLDEKMKRGEKFFSTTVEEISVEEDGRILLAPLGYRNYYTKPDFAEFIFRYRDEITRLPEWTSVLECMSRDVIIDKHLKHQIRSPFGMLLMDEFHLLHGIIWMLVDEKRPFHFNPDIFNSAYSKIESIFYSEIVTRRSICLLLGFDSEVEEIDLGDGLKIRKTSKDEIVELWRESNSFRALVEFFPEISLRGTPVKYVLELSIEAPKIADNEKYEVEPADTTFEKVVSALRLFKGGWLDYPFIRERVTSTFPSGSHYTMGMKGRGIPSEIPLGISYRLSKKETEEFKEFYKRIDQKIDCSKIPLKRFNETYKRVNLEDKLIDYMIAFEALFLRGTKITPTGHTIGIASSLIIGKNDDEREEIKDFLIKAYSIRNDIVHGSEYETEPIVRGKRYTFNDFVSKTEDYLRESIKKLL